MNVTSHPVSPVQPIGSNVTLMCTVELSPAVTASMTVNTVWTGPAGFSTTNTEQLVMGSNTNYVSTATVKSFKRNSSGDYICRATVISESKVLASLSGIKRITAGKTFEKFSHTNEYVTVDINII